MTDASSNLNCPSCEFVGKSPQSLKVHVGRAHGSPKKAGTRGPGRGGRRGKTCNLCGKVLKTSPALKTHMTRMHAGETVGQATAHVGKATPLDRDLMGLSLAALAELFEAGKRELQRRLTGLLT